MRKLFNATALSLAAAATLSGAALTAAAPAAAQSRYNGVTNCEATGGRQAAGAAIGGAAGAGLGMAVTKKDTLGAIVGGLAGAAAGSYIGCNQQKARVANTPTPSSTYYARSTVNLRAQPTTSSARVGQLMKGQTFQVIGGTRDWLLVSDNRGTGAGYVSAAYARPAG